MASFSGGNLPSLAPQLYDLGFKVLHKCARCGSSNCKDGSKPHMSCHKCNLEWCWTCGWEMTHWFHHYQGDEKIICDLINDCYFGVGRFEFPTPVRVGIMFFILTAGPFIAWAVASCLIVFVYFLILFKLGQITKRWDVEKKKLLADP